MPIVLTSHTGGSAASLPQTFSGTSDPNQRVEIKREDGTLLGWDLADGSGNWSIEVTSWTGSGGGAAIELDTNFPKNQFVSNVATATITSPSFTVGGNTRTLVAVVFFYTGNSENAHPVTMEWVGGTPAAATDWVCRAWPVGTTGNTTTSFTGTQTSGSDIHDGTIHWTAQIWTSTWSGTPASASVIATRTYPQQGEMTTAGLSIYSFANASTTFGNAAQHHTPMSEVNGPNQELLIPITASASGSQIVGIAHWGNLPDNDTFDAHDSNTAIDYQNEDGGNQGGGVAFRLNGTTTASTQYTLGFDQTTSARYAWSMVVLEVLKQ